MRTEAQKAAFYELLALDYTNQSIVLRCRASVHLENRDDGRFWNKLLQTYRPGSYNYIYSSLSAEGNMTSGCIQCLQFAAYLSDRFFVCIDSDYRYLRQESVLNDKYVLQTYTYSWENHYYHGEHLQSSLNANTPEAAFDFCSFLNRYSSIVYKPLLVYLYMDRQNLKGFGQKNFNDIMALQYQAGDLDNGGETMLNRFKANVESFLASLGEVDGFDFDEEKSHYEGLNLCEANAYLHVRGHNLYHTLASLGNHLCRHFEDKVLLKDINAVGYWEIERCRDDIQAI